MLSADITGSPVQTVSVSAMLIAGIGFLRLEIVANLEYVA
jgi:hypothetical protein